MDIASISPSIITDNAGVAQVNILDNDGKQRINWKFSDGCSVFATAVVNLYLSSSIFTCPSVDATVQLTSASFSRTEGDLTTVVCVQALLGSATGTFEAPLTVEVTPTPGTAGQLSDYIILQFILHVYLFLV